jgi:fructose transport system ATP-binding protein
MESQPLLQLRGIRKAFGAVHALDGVDFDLYPREVVGLVGDNGAGKSTLIKIISGALQPDHGTIYFEGRHVTLRSPLDARELGIETVYQDLAVIPYMNVEANLFLGREITGRHWWNRWLLNKKAMRQAAAQHVASLQVNLRSVRQHVGTLSGGQRQSVAVARAISWGRKIVIMDEPTAALGIRESRGVLDLIKRVAERGISVVFISHNMPHVFEVTDRIVVLRHGREAGQLITRDASMNDVVGLITGVQVVKAAG